MIQTDFAQNGLPTLVCLHFLGGSAASWSHVIPKLTGKLQSLALDLPGFGGSADLKGYSVAEMADSVVARLTGIGKSGWMLAGHSMGAKVAAVVARRAEDGEPGLAGLRGVVLVSGSPPGPEPIPDAQRQSMLGWFTGDPAAWPDQARDYIGNNVVAGLPPAVMDRAVADLLRMRPDAWAAWLQSGSREDWTDRVGVLRTPALILAGSDDPNLGQAAQRDLTAPHYAERRLTTVAGVKHLMPMEQPDDVARLIAAHAGAVCQRT